MIAVIIRWDLEKIYQMKTEIMLKEFNKRFRMFRMFKMFRILPNLIMLLEININNNTSHLSHNYRNRIN